MVPMASVSMDRPQLPRGANYGVMGQSASRLAPASLAWQPAAVFALRTSGRLRVDQVQRGGHHPGRQHQQDRQSRGERDKLARSCC